MLLLWSYKVNQKILESSLMPTCHSSLFYRPPSFIFYVPCAFLLLKGWLVLLFSYVLTTVMLYLLEFVNPPSNKPQYLQNLASRILSGARVGDHITPILESLLPVRYRYFKTLVLTYKALHYLAKQGCIYLIICSILLFNNYVFLLLVIVVVFLVFKMYSFTLSLFLM